MKKERHPKPSRGRSAKYAMTEPFPELVDRVLKAFLSDSSKKGLELAQAQAYGKE